MAVKQRSLLPDGKPNRQQGWEDSFCVYLAGFSANPRSPYEGGDRSQVSKTCKHSPGTAFDLLIYPEKVFLVIDNSRWKQLGQTEQCCPR